METTKELSVCTMTNKQLQEDIGENRQLPEDEDEHLTGNNCPRCGYPTVIEYGLEVCYHCGWSKEE